MERGYWYSLKNYNRGQYFIFDIKKDYMLIYDNRDNVDIINTIPKQNTWDKREGWGKEYNNIFYRLFTNDERTLTILKDWINL